MVPPGIGWAVTMSACRMPAAVNGFFSCVIAETRSAARPAACGDAMLVPWATSSPAFQRGTVL